MISDTNWTISHSTTRDSILNISIDIFCNSTIIYCLIIDLEYVFRLSSLLITDQNTQLCWDMLQFTSMKWSSKWVWTYRKRYSDYESWTFRSRTIVITLNFWNWTTNWTQDSIQRIDWRSILTRSKDWKSRIESSLSYHFCSASFRKMYLSSSSNVETKIRTVLTTEILILYR